MGMLAGVRLKGIDPAPFLAAAGVPATILSNEQARIPIGDYAALYNIVVRELDDEAFALFSSPLRLGTFEFLCRGVRSSPDLREALERTARFMRLVLPDLRIALECEGATARITLAERRRLRPRDDDPARVFAFEWLLRLLHGLACWLVARSLPLNEVAFPYPAPAHAADYALVYTERSRFGGAELVATLDSAFLDLPVRRDERELEGFLLNAPGKIAMLYRRDREMARAVRELLARSLAAAPGLEGAARALHVSPRTLHRRLREEGTSFRDLKDRVRRELALARLRKPRQSVADLAAELGYSEPSAFFRAFRAWTGMAPTEFRRRHAS